jgi:hypothetical protein
MPEFTFTSPEGKSYTVAGPDGATKEQAFQILQQQLKTAPPKAATPQAEENPTSLTNLAGAAIEPMMTMGSAALNQIPAGLAGVGNTLTNALGITHKDPADTVNSIKDAFTYEPRTTGGKNAMEAFSAPGEQLAKITPYLTDKLGLNPTESMVSEMAFQGLPQILGMKGARAATEAAPGVLKPKTPSPEVQMLANKNVTLTPGTARGGMLKNMEEKAQSIPVLGDIIKNARGKSVEQFSQATVNDALADISQKLPSGLKGHDAVRHAGEQFDAAYNGILPKLKGDLNSAPATGSTLPQKTGTNVSPATQSFRAELDQIKSMGQQGLPPEKAARLTQIIDNTIVSKFTSAGKANGHTLQEIRENLKNQIDAHMQSKTPEDRQIGLALITARESMDAMIERANPGTLGQQYGAIRRGYAKYSIAQRAASFKGAKEGVATPSQYNSAVRAKDRSKGKRKFAEGRALQQPLAKAGEKVLGGIEPDSGTAGRAAFMEGLLGLGGGGAIATMGHPLMIGLGAAAIPILYSQMGLKALQPFLLGQKRTAPGVAGGLAGGAMQDKKKRPPPPLPDRALAGAGIGQ